MAHTTCNHDNLTTRILLGFGVAAGPLYVAVGLLQMAIRPGFDMTRHALSLMENGDLGWVQIANFFVTGLLVIWGAIGLRRATRPGKGSFWASLLVGIYGAGMIGAGVFTADPALGFPVGTPADAMTISWHGLLHFVCGGVGFLSLIAGTFVLSRRFAKQGEKGWATFSVFTGMAFFAAFFGIASGAGNPALTVAFYVAVVIVWTWMSLTMAKFRRAVPDDVAATDVVSVGA